MLPTISQQSELLEQNFQGLACGIKNRVDFNLAPDLQNQLKHEEEDTTKEASIELPLPPEIATRVQEDLNEPAQWILIQGRVIELRCWRLVNSKPTA